jgi:hypothetical protein
MSGGWAINVGSHFTGNVAMEHLLTVLAAMGVSLAIQRWVARWRLRRMLSKR